MMTEAAPHMKERETQMVINMNSVKSGVCSVCSHAFNVGFPVKLDLSTKLTTCQSHPEYLVKVERVETTLEERATLKSQEGFTVLVTAPKSKNHGNVITITERVFNPRYNSFFFVGINEQTGEKVNLGENTKAVVLFKSVRTESYNPHYISQ